MSRKAPGGVRLEHMILQAKIVGVGPIIGNSALGVLAHNYDAWGGSAACRVSRVRAALLASFRFRDKTSHLPAVDIGRCVHRTVRAAKVPIGGVVERG